MDFNFDEVIDRVGTHSSKWDTMQQKYGVSPQTGIAMWVADMDFRAPPAVQEALAGALDHGVHGYFGDDSAYRTALVNWVKRRHDWDVQPGWIINAHGLGYGVSLCVKAFSAPGDGVIVFSPVYHAFARIIKATGRQLVESPLVERNGRYVMDLDALAASLTGAEKMIVFCSPHNPGGRVWDEAELRQLVAFCETHDLVLVSDEVHNDLVYKRNQHHVLAHLVPEMAHRLVTLVATTKTFNLAGCMIGSIVAPDAYLHSRLTKVAASASGNSFNRIGMLMCTAAWQYGDAWLDSLLDYLDENRRIFEDGIAAIPGLKAMPLEATYLCWVDFSGTGMSEADYLKRVEGDAQIAVNHGATFGRGGETFLRFNIACRRALVVEAVNRLKSAFSDLQ
ncbi:MAG: MalY/PatB family protein [Candidatus Puniceispirillum sp.]